MREWLIEKIQAHVARGAITASTVRGYVSGTVEEARTFLAALPLSQFGVSDRAAFSRRLDRATDDLLRRLPRAAARWGLARKLLNIFLRDCLYNAYLRRQNALGLAERHLEIPVDSITAKELRKRHRTLARWRGVGELTPGMSEEYQQEARADALEKGVARVHLDAIWWGAR